MTHKKILCELDNGYRHLVTVNTFKSIWIFSSSAVYINEGEEVMF